uniref:Lipoprotein n=1 Tax=Magnetococcus massalia (strain MO-1) TaxID=451514 RepID=A0A1S7LM85_MAGMO|nr:Conserved exported protein of unknown function [Candidatus Magnetococcus massalia]
MLLHRRIAALALTAALTLLASGCSSPHAATNVALSDPSQVLTPSQTVKLLHSFPERPHERIAQLETTGNEAAHSEIYLIENMRAKAREIGADAIIIDDKPSQQVIGTESWVGPTVIRTLKGYAIRWKDDNP